MKHWHFTNVIIYEDENVAEILKTLITKFENVFTDIDQTINISKNQWMFIKLKKKIVLKSFKMYFVDQKKREIINVTFDKFQTQNKLHYIIQSIVYNYSIFVIWKNTLNERKSRVVINIKDLNEIIKNDIYSLFLQTNIIVNVTNFSFIFTVDVVNCIHQFNVKYQN